MPVLKLALLIFLSTEGKVSVGIISDGWVHICGTVPLVNT